MIRIGLGKAAASKSMWVTTGGTNSGVMKYVAEAIAESGQYMPVIGVAAWSVVRNKPCLTTYADGGPVAGGLVYYGDPDSHQPMPFCSLDRNHSHFVLVDDGTQDKFGGEISSRAAMEKSVAELLSLGTFGSESPISTVLLSIQGGPGTVNTIKASLQQGTPVVLVNGSGKSSTAMAYAMQLPKPGERADNAQFTDQGLRELIMNEFQIAHTHPIFKQVYDTCIECVTNEKYRALIHVYTVDYSGEGGEYSLDVAILNAVLAHDAEQWAGWNTRMGVDSSDLNAMVRARTRERDLSRALRLEMALLSIQVRSKEH